jgi:tRNA (cmo5U34)-methyltransferase
MTDWNDRFYDPEIVSQYAEGPPRFMPGYGDMQIMTAILLAERAADNGAILVLGAGGGMEMRAFLNLQPQWRLTGVDPAVQMLDLARATLGRDADRTTLIEGLIDAAPPGPFAGACALLTLHFLPAEERLRTLRAIHARLAPGAAFVAAHSSFPQASAERAPWLARYAAFARAKGADAALVEQAAQALAATVEVLDPAQDERLLQQAGFSAVTPFYTGFTWRGWVGYA